MLKLSRPSPALVVATIALFVAAGGGAWAATTNANSALYARATSHPKASVASAGFAMKSFTVVVATLG